MQGYKLPEWSHMTRAEGERFTRCCNRSIDRDFWGPNARSSPPNKNPRISVCVPDGAQEGFFTQPRGLR